MTLAMQMTVGLALVLAWYGGAVGKAAAIAYWRRRADYWFNRSVDLEGQRDARRIPAAGSVPDFPRPMGATPPAPPRPLLYDFHDGPARWMDVDALPTVDV